jgi:hypothetical protein
LYRYTGETLFVTFATKSVEDFVVGTAQVENSIDRVRLKAPGFNP